jgi:hypothetical protein
VKIVDRKTFLALPPETLFSKYEPCVFFDLLIKGETWGNDFLYQSINDAIESAGSDDFANKLFTVQASGESLPMDFNCQGRDGLFDDDQLFAVWEPADVLALITRLGRCVPHGVTEDGSC